MTARLPASDRQVDSEINILRGERDQAKDIIDDLQKKLGAVNAVLSDYDAERQVRAGRAGGQRGCLRLRERALRVVLRLLCGRCLAWRCRDARCLQHCWQCKPASLLPCLLSGGARTLSLARTQRSHARPALSLSLLGTRAGH